MQHKKQFVCIITAPQAHCLYYKPNHLTLLGK